MATESPANNTLPPIYDDIVEDANAVFTGGLTHRANRNGGVAVALDDQLNWSVDANNGTAAPLDDSVKSEDEALDPIQLPQSTYSLLFSEPALSIPFGFAVIVILISFMCLYLAFADGLRSEQISIPDVVVLDPGGLLNIFVQGIRSHNLSIPANVTPAVRIAQYLSIVIAILMEEEIPTGLYLLRMIPNQSLHQKFPRMKYYKFVISSCLRIINGYFFILNVMLVLIRSTGVLEIFYDVLALQFVQQLDDIAFALAKKDVFGKRLQRACTAKCFRVEFGQQRLGRNKNVSKVLKGLTALNFGWMVILMSIVTANQLNGVYHPDSITVTFGSTAVWENALAKKPWYQNSTEYEERRLLYSFFSGVYRRNGIEAGRPVYWEARKTDNTPYEKTTPAVFKYCPEISAWVFMNQDIKKIEDSSGASCETNWLLRSHHTLEYDLLSVTTGWRVWVGTIDKADTDIVSNECEEKADCNFNGICVDGKCECHKKDDVRYLGVHCEVIVPLSCETLIGEDANLTYQVKYEISRSEGSVPDMIETAYSRPAYYSDPDGTGTSNRLDLSILSYAGNRWYVYTAPDDKFYHVAPEDVPLYRNEIHAFWYGILERRQVELVSDPTTRSTPMGVDFNYILDRGEQFAPQGAIQPIQPNGAVGKGYFRCGGPVNNTIAARKLQYKNMIGYDNRDSHDKTEN